MNQSKQLVQLIEIAIMTGIALILDMVSGMFLKMPQGGSIAVMMIPIFLISFRWGLKAGLATGFLAGLLQFVTGGFYVVHPLQLLLDYFIAPTAAGIGGFFAGSIRNASFEKQKGKIISYVMLAVLLGSGLKFLAHVISGAVFLETMRLKALRYGFIHWYIMERICFRLSLSAQSSFVYCC